MACLLSACKSTLQASRVLLSKTDKSNKAYQEPVLRVKHIWSDFQNCFFLLVFHGHLLASVGHQNVTYLQLYRNAGAAWRRYCLRREIPERFSCCRGPMLAASETEFLNGWLKANLPGSFTVLRRNQIFSLNLSGCGSGDDLQYTNRSEILYGWNISGSFRISSPVSYFWCLTRTCCEELKCSCVIFTFQMEHRRGRISLTDLSQAGENINTKFYGWHS